LLLLNTTRVYPRHSEFLTVPFTVGKEGRKKAKMEGGGKRVEGKDEGTEDGGGREYAGQGGRKGGKGRREGVRAGGKEGREEDKKGAGDRCSPSRGQTPSTQSFLFWTSDMLLGAWYSSSISGYLQQ
jgi:hypothetical protein